MKIFLIAVLVFMTSFAQSQSVYPEAAENLKLYELGDAVLLFMPSISTEIINWDFQSGADIVWLSDGFQSRVLPDKTEIYYRNGLVRIHVQGNKSYILKKVRNELAWTVRWTPCQGPF